MERAPKSTPEDVINPEIPTTPQEAYELFRICVEALRNGRRVEGVTPKHIGPEGMYALKHPEVSKDHYLTM